MLVGGLLVVLLMGFVVGFVMGFVMDFTSASEVNSLVALSNSLFAWPIILAISGTFDGPQRKSTMSIVTMTNPSNPKRGNSFHRHGQRSVPYKNTEFIRCLEIK